jgi:hypothetical protein
LLLEFFEQLSNVEVEFPLEGDSDRFSLDMESDHSRVDHLRPVGIETDLVQAEDLRRIIGKRRKPLAGGTRRCFHDRLRLRNDTSSGTIGRLSSFTHGVSSLLAEVESFLRSCLERAEHIALCNLARLIDAILSDFLDALPDLRRCCNGWTHRILRVLHRLFRLRNRGGGFVDHSCQTRTSLGKLHKSTHHTAHMERDSE